jgi:hypothetical protein
MVVGWLLDEVTDAEDSTVEVGLYYPALMISPGLMSLAVI